MHGLPATACDWHALLSGVWHASRADALPALRRRDRAQRALLRPVRQLSQQLEADRGVRLQVRIGVHSGLLVVGEVGAGPTPDPMGAVGETANLAARLQSLATADTLLISEATRQLVRGLLECHDRGAQALKGLSHPVHIYQVVRESNARSRFEAAAAGELLPLVGRQQELGRYSSAGSRSVRVAVRWSCSAAKPASASPAWCTLSRSTWPAIPRRG